MPIFYTYRSFEEFDGGRSYIGYRKCPAGETPETDSYLGSYRDKTFTPTAKEILGIYDSKEEALRAEITLHKKFDVARNPHFANKATQTSTKFCIIKHSEDTRRRMSEARKGENHPLYGKSLSNETKRKISEALKGKKSKLLDWYHPNHGDIFQTSATELVRLFPGQNLDNSILSKVALGKRSHHKGWQCVNIEPSKIRNGTQGTMAERTT